MSEPLILVTGVTGYVASWVAYTCLKAGFRVRGTVRSLAEQDRFVHLAKDFCPKAKGAKHTIKLVEADLMNPSDWESALQNVTYCIHIASPFPLASTDPADKDDLIRPAVEGTLNVLRACSSSKTVKRVVLTSSAAAVAYGKSVDETELNDETWTVLDDPKFPVGAYEESKTRAEQAAWEFVKSNTPTWDLCTILPTLIVGNPFSKNPCPSVGLMQQVLLGNMLYLPDIIVDCVSTEDVARAHLLAVLTPEAGGKRFLVHGAQISLQDVGRLFVKEFGKRGWNPTSWNAPRWILEIFAWFDPKVGNMLPKLGIKRNWNCQNCVNILKLIPNDNAEEMFLDLVYGSVRLGIVENKSALLRDNLHLPRHLIERLPGESMDLSDLPRLS